MMENTVNNSNNLSLSSKRLIICGILYVISIYITLHYNLGETNQSNALLTFYSWCLNISYPLLTIISIFPEKLKYSAKNPQIKNVIKIFWVLMICNFLAGFSYWEVGLGMTYLFTGILFNIFGRLTNRFVTFISYIMLIFGLLEPTGFFYSIPLIASFYHYIQLYFLPISFILIGLYNIKKSR